MSETKHTPGPFTLRGPSMVRGRPETGDYIAIVAGGRVIAEVYLQTDKDVFEPVLNNALLFAAAPDLLAACQRVLGSQMVQLWMFPDIAKEVQAAITKAQGQ